MNGTITSGLGDEKNSLQISPREFVLVQVVPVSEGAIGDDSTSGLAPVYAMACPAGIKNNEALRNTF